MIVSKDSFDSVTPGLILKNKKIGLLGASLTENGILTAINAKKDALNQIYTRYFTYIDTQNSMLAFSVCFNELWPSDEILSWIY